MTSVWGVHNDRFNTELVEGEFISVGYDEMNRDLREIGFDRESLKAALTLALPDEKPRAIAGWAGVLLRFGLRWSRAT